jgi:hypothetical protein
MDREAWSWSGKVRAVNVSSVNEVAVDLKYWKSTYNDEISYTSNLLEKHNMLLDQFSLTSFIHRPPSQHHQCYRDSDIKRLGERIKLNDLDFLAKPSLPKINPELQSTQQTTQNGLNT